MESLAAIHRASSLGGNDASLHALGRQSRRLVDNTRDALLHVLGVARREVVFCGGMREANTLAALGLAQTQRETHRRHGVILTDDASWDSIAQVLARHSFAVHRLAQATDTGAHLLADASIAMVCVPWMCDTMRRVRELQAWHVLAQRLGAWLHVDASLGLAHGCRDPFLQNAASITVGSTPLGGPSGVAALVLMRNVSPTPLWGGGGQQRGVRSGTAATPQVAGFGAAILAMQEDRLGAA